MISLRDRTGKWEKKEFAAAIFGGVVWVGIIAALGATASDASDTAPQHTAASKATASKPVVSAPVVSAPVVSAPVVSAPVAPKWGVEGAVSHGISVGEWDITFPISDNLTGGMIRAVAADDVMKILTAVQDSGKRNFDLLHIVGTFDMQDAQGQPYNDAEVLWVNFTRADVERIVVANLRPGQLSAVEAASCSFGMNPAMGYKLNNTASGNCG
jgi:hypothetical protein